MLFRFQLEFVFKIQMYTPTDHLHQDWNETRRGVIEYTYPQVNRYIIMPCESRVKTRVRTI